MKKTIMIKISHRALGWMITGKEINESTIDTIFLQVPSKTPERIQDTNRAAVKHIDKIWSLDLLDIGDYRTKNY